MKRSLAVLGLVWGLPLLAGADERGTFVAIDRQGTASAVGLDASLFFIKDIDAVDMGLRQNLWGRYVSSMGVGGYGQISFTQLIGDISSEVGVSNLELGVLYALPLEGVDVTFRLGFGIPTAPDSGGSAASNVLNFPVRMHDLALILPHALWLRPGL